MYKTMLTEEKIREILRDKEELDGVTFFDKHYEYLDEHIEELLLKWLMLNELEDSLGIRTTLV